MSSRYSTIYTVSGLWVVLMGVALWTRPHLPVDETRYLAVAWEMWLRGDFLVPYLNGEPYSHKPPLLFWLMHAGWGVFGVNDWWPRLIAPLFGLGCLFLTRGLAVALWPNDKQTRELAPLLLMGCVFWSLFVTLTMFDMMLAFFGLLGLLGVTKAYMKRQWVGFALVIIAVGFGILTKGPAILLHILPVALTAPLWAKWMADNDGLLEYKRSHWYLQLLGCVVLGVAMALVWAIPAGIGGGEAYQQAIFWGQAAGRMVESFAHQRPIWWYAVILPALIMPWFIWPTLWKALCASGASLWQDGRNLFCLIWFATAFIAFSLISGKQLHYLLPEFPALALIAARSLSQHSEKITASRWAGFLPSLLFGVLGIALVFLPLGLVPARLPDWAPEVDGYWGALILCLAVLGLISSGANIIKSVTKLLILPVGFVVSLHLALAPVLWARYDMKPISMQLKTWEDAGIPLALFGKNHGQFQFSGRLTHPMATVGQLTGQLEAFLKQNPTAYIVAFYKRIPDQATPVAIYPFRQHFMVVWDAKTMIEHPGIGNRI